MSSKHQEQPAKTRVSGTRILVWVLVGVLVLSLLGVGGLYYVKTRLQAMQFTESDLNQLLNDAQEVISQDLQDAVNLPDEPEDEEPSDKTEDVKKVTDEDLKQGEQTKVETAEAVPTIKNYLLLGVDTREEKDVSGRCDVMILVTVDTKNKAIKLTSFMRDILIPIEGLGKNRLNIVYQYKGPDVTVKTIEDIAGVKIDGYGIVNFYTVAKIIDILDGVDVENLSNEEKNDLNNSVKEMNQYVENKSELLKDTGSVHLNGLQATAYMRIRHVGRGDYQRTERQRTVISTLFKGLKNMNLAQMLTLVDKITPLVKTNLNSVQILALANDVYSLRSCDVQQLRIPLDEAHYMGMYNDMSVLIIDSEANAAAVKEFIYGSGN